MRPCCARPAGRGRRRVDELEAPLSSLEQATAIGRENAVGSTGRLLSGQ